MCVLFISMQYISLVECDLIFTQRNKFYEFQLFSTQQNALLTQYRRVTLRGFFEPSVSKIKYFATVCGFLFYPRLNLTPVYTAGKLPVAKN